MRSLARQKRVRWVMAALGLVLFPACRTPSVADPENVPYSAFRPAFSESPPRRTLFLGGYAGYNYAPIGRRNRIPTEDGGMTWGVPSVVPNQSLNAP